MRYFGGKQRIVKPLVTFMQSYVNERGIYVEPFVGGASVIAAVKAPIRIGADANAALICMWDALCKGWDPPDVVDEELYRAVKDAKLLDDPLTAFIGFGCSFAGKWFGGYARDATGGNYAKMAYNSLAKKVATLHGVQWVAGDYRTLTYPDGCLIYCDPPYQGTTQYGAVGNFDTATFWEFCREKSRLGHIVFVSEYAAPDDFHVVWSVETKTDMRMRDGEKDARTEKLFTFSEVWN